MARRMVVALPIVTQRVRDFLVRAVFVVASCPTVVEERAPVHLFANLAWRSAIFYYDDDRHGSVWMVQH
jgi:hypothetical protein